MAAVQCSVSKADGGVHLACEEIFQRVQAVICYPTPKSRWITNV